MKLLDGMHVREALRFVERSQSGLGGQQIAAYFGALAVGIARHQRPAAPFQELVNTAAMMEQQRLFLEVRLERESNPGRRAVARRSRRRMHRGRPLGQAHRICGQHDARWIAHSTLACPHRRLHAALGRKLARQCTGGGRLEKLQGAIEVGLADPVGATNTVSRPVGKRIERSDR